MQVYTKMWLDNVLAEKRMVPNKIYRELILWMTLAHMFHLPDLFKNITKVEPESGVADLNR